MTNIPNGATHINLMSSVFYKQCNGSTYVYVREHWRDSVYYEFDEFDGLFEEVIV